MDNEKLFELMEKMYGEMQKGFKKVDGRLTNVENTVTRIEYDHGQKLEALFDGYKQNTETLNRIEDQVARHEAIIIRKVK